MTYNIGVSLIFQEKQYSSYRYYQIIVSKITEGKGGLPSPVLPEEPRHTLSLLLLFLEADYSHIKL